MNNPSLWAEYNAMSRSFGSDFAKEYEEEIGKMSGRCIDVGSGPCDVLVDFLLPKLDPEATVICSDISDDMLEFAKKKYKNNPRLSFMKLDIETPNLPKDLIEQFDNVTSFHCLHWCQNIRQDFENFYKLLKPGGTLLLTFMSHFPGLNCYKDLAAIPRYKPYMQDADRWFSVFQHSEDPLSTLKPLIKDVGFEIRHCSVREKGYMFDDFDVFSKLMLSVNPFIDRMPADVKKEYEKDLPREFAKRSIMFNKNSDKEQEYNILCLVHTFYLHLRKPAITKNSN